MMKILCISDKVDPLIDSSGIRERFGDVDMVLAAGDLPTDYLSYIVSALDKPLLFIFGNHDLKPLPYYQLELESGLRPLDDYGQDGGGTYVGFKTHKESGLIVLGLDGSIRYNKGYNQFSQLGMWLKVVSMVPALLFNRLFFGRSVDVVLAHAPPRGVHDKGDPCHRGFNAYLWLMKVFKPRYLVHGHIHLYDSRDNRTSCYLDTTVVNAYGHYILEIGDDHA